MEVLDDQWIPHFAKLEAGEVLTNDELFRKCIQRNIAPPSATARDLKELPSRFEIEKILRSLQPGKAAGPDSLPSDLFHHAASTLVNSVHDLYSKAVWWATEPIQSKGGLMFPIHKRGSTEDAANFRGIMLLNVLSKAHHKWLRQKVAGRLEGLRCDTQIGGFKHQQAAFGSHCVQTAARLSHLADQPPTVQATLAGVYKAFERRGLLLNMGRGKTVAVLAFRGPQAPEYRRQQLLVEHPGTWVQIDKRRQIWLDFGTSYRHLGALFVPDGEIPHEVRSRMGQAKVAYNSMKKVTCTAIFL